MLDYVCDYCGEENDESCPLVENIKGDIVCECCIGRDQTTPKLETANA